MGVDNRKAVFFILEVVRIFLEVIGALTILKYVFLEGQKVVTAGGNFVCSVRKTINKIKNSKQTNNLPDQQAQQTSSHYHQKDQS